MPRQAVDRERAWLKGHEDGVLGQTWLEHRRILEYETGRERGEKSFNIERSLAEAEASLEFARESAGRAREELDRVDIQLRAATVDHDGNPGNYSRSTGWLYLFFALILVVADFPLSKMIGNVMMNERSDSPFLSESSAVAAGIVVISLFFKLIADPFMRPRYLMHPWLAWMSWSVSRIAGVILMVAVAASVAMLGAFRGQAVAVNSADTAPPVRVLGSDRSVTETTGAAASRPRSATLLDRLSDIEFLSRWAFVTLGLTLPIVGGIFASAGAAKLHNASHLSEIRKAGDARRRAYETYAQELNARSAEHGKLKKELEAIAQTPMSADGQYHLYLHGYERGFCSAAFNEHGEGISDAVRLFVFKWLAIAQQTQNNVRTASIATQERVEARVNIGGRFDSVRGAENEFSSQAQRDSSDSSV
jgi:hypothetical protein